MTTQIEDELWSAIADPSRRQVLDLIVSNGAVSASWLAGRVPFSRQAVSKHLAVLEVDAGRLDQATRSMAELAAQWDRRLAAIKRIAEAAHAQSKRRERHDEHAPGR
jgi:ArsR family transcriptional regulator, cadmium/lead-responsive transcriptional repressor